MYELYIFGCIIIFTLVLLAFNNRSIEGNLMKGFWCADASFCKKAELDMFVLYLGDNVSHVGNSRHGYLLASNENGIILNNPICMTFSGSMNILGMSSREYNVTIDWKDSPPTDEKAFPTNCQACFYPKYGKLVFYDQNQVIVSLWKDNQMSSLSADEELHPGHVVEENDDHGEDI